MRKLTAVCLAIAMLLTFGMLFSVSAAEPETSSDLSCGENAFGAYLTVRENAENHDMRVLLVAKEATLATLTGLTFTAAFTTEDSEKSVTEVIDSDYVFFRSVTAAGVTYHAKEGYVFFGIVITDIGYSVWSKVSVKIKSNETEASFSLNYADAIRKDTENLLNMKAEELYPVETSAYEVAPLSMYHYYDATKYTNMEIHELRVPVSGCEVGDTLTVTVSRWAQYQNYQIGDVHGVDNITYTLVATEACDRGFVTFSDLSISLPYGYSFFIGSATDTVELLFLPTSVPNVDPTYMIQHLSYIPIEIYGYSYDSYFSEVLTGASSLYNLSVAPFVFMNPDLFSN
ncbi:MAG: hypothetical protein IJW46_00215, partial [Clostridia bacterium]|nr:hypothetical protein [Clostridia bacterium]